MFVIYFAKDYVDHIYNELLTLTCRETLSHIHGSLILLDKEYE